LYAHRFFCCLPIDWVIKIHALDVSLCVLSVNETTNLQAQKFRYRYIYKTLFLDTMRRGFNHSYIISYKVLTMITNTARPSTTAMAMTATVPTGLSVDFLMTVSLLFFPGVTITYGVSVLILDGPLAVVATGLEEGLAVVATGLAVECLAVVATGLAVECLAGALVVGTPVTPKNKSTNR
jgi:hypothetical protein